MLLAIQSAVGIACGSIRSYISAGTTQHVKVENGTWTTSGGYLGSGTTGATISIGDIITTGDFVFRATLRGNSFGNNPGTVVINGLGEFGFVRTNADSPMYTRGFFFGDITRNLVHRSNFLTDGEDFVVEISRAGDLARVSINGQTAWRNTYEGDRQFGKIGFRNGAGRLKIKSAELISGSYGPMNQWQNLQTIDHELPGQQVDVFARGSGGYHTYRIPAIERTRSGVLLAFCEGRKNDPNDDGEIHLLMSRSLDGGMTWEAPKVIYSEPGEITIGNPMPIYDRQTNRTVLLFCRNNDRVFQTVVFSDGQYWSTPEEITSDVKLSNWGWYATGPGHGLITKSGRMIAPSNHGSGKAHTIYSDDRGQTWKLGGTMPGYGNEVTAAETSGGRILMNSRNATSAYYRRMASSDDGGVTWNTPEERRDLVEPTCQGSIRSITMEDGKELLLFSNPASVRRERMTVRLSEDGGATWTEGKRIYEGSAAYSDLAYLGDGWIGCLYERDWYNSLTFARFHISWLRDSRIDKWYEEEVQGN